jgi:site-specific DNA recombinase
MEGQRVAIYARVSSEEQRENQTIQTQIDTAKRWVEFQRLVNKPMEVYDLYLDDGVSGTIPFAQRPAGKRLLQDATSEKFTMILVYKIDRLGRDPRDILNSAHQFDQIGVAVKSLTEEFDMSTPSGKFMFNIFAAAAGFARDSQIERSIEGTNHWAKEGVWLGGIVPYGYYVAGQKKQARLVVSEVPLQGLTLSEADVVRMIYRMLAEEGLSCVKIAEHLNALGVPPAYTKDHRQITRKGPEGKRQQHTAGVWRYGRIRNLVVNSVYKGEHLYGRRSQKTRALIPRAVPAIVDIDTWERAQQTLRRNMLVATRNALRQYLLRGLITCGVCGLRFCGTQTRRSGGKDDVYYICGGKIPSRGRIQGRCPSKMVRAIELEETVWRDILSFLHDPGPILAQLAQHLHSRQTQSRSLEQERTAQAVALSHKEDEKERILDLYRRGRITIADLERQLEKISQEEAALKARLTSLETTLRGQEAIASRLMEARDLLHNLRQRLKEEFTWEDKRELIESLVLEIRVDTIGEGKEKAQTITVTYAFDSSIGHGCVANHTGMDSWLRLTLNVPGTSAS